jgi:hypothetical protein
MSRTHATVLVAILSVTAGSTVRAQSLAEAAQQEAARRKEVKGTVRVITNKDLPNVAPATAVAPAPAAPTDTPPPDSGVAVSGAAATKDPQAAKGDETSATRDEKYWRDRLAEAKKKVADSQVLIEALQSRINALTTDFVNRDDPAQRAVIAGNRDEAIATLENYRKAIVDGTKAVGDIEEEARRAGVPAGWLR